ncbi:hypothetical protein J6590_048208 [Homalodisca vitripennis]|nr:hypothetical protein J6590_048208 [Homalodisca vitripennis]
MACEAHTQTGFSDIFAGARAFRGPRGPCRRTRDMTGPAKAEYGPKHDLPSFLPANNGNRLDFQRETFYPQLQR